LPHWFSLRRADGRKSYCSTCLIQESTAANRLTNFTRDFSLSAVTPPCRALDRHNIEADCDPFLVTANSRDDVKGISDDYKPGLS